MTVCVLGDEGVVTDALCSYGVRIEVLGRTRNSPLHRARWLLRVIRENSFDIIHAHTGGRLPRLMARIVTGARIISHLHGLPPGMSESFRARKPKAAGFIADAALGADLLLTCSAWMTDGVRILLNDAKAVHTLYAGVDVPWLDAHPPPSTSREALGVGADAVVIGFIGRLVEQKGVMYLLDAAAAMAARRPGAVFVVVGDGPLRPSLEARTAKLGLRNVRFVGEVTDVRPLLSACDIMVMTSEWEPFGIVNLESMAMGKPVVAFDVDGIPESVVNDETGLLVPHRDVLALTHALLRLHDDAGLRNRLGVAGRRKVTEAFSAERTARTLEGIYAGLMRESPVR